MASIRSIARKLNLSPTAVSLALKGSPRVSKAVREQVLREAETSGYVPNARLSELMNEIRSAQVPGFHSTLGAFSLFPREKPWEEPNYHHLRDVFEGARDCAEKRGYKLDLLWLRAPGMNPERFRTIIEARGIRGLFCLGSLQPDEPLPQVLYNFPIVANAASVASPLHRVASHFAHDCKSLLDELALRGYRRPGLVFKKSGERRTDFAYTSTFLGYQDRVLPPPHVPILRIEDWDRAAFADWFGRHQPDALVLHHEPDFIRNAEAVVKSLKLKIPADVGLALLDKNPEPKRYSGIIQDHRLMGSGAIEMLIGRIHMNDFGPPAKPKFELVEGFWNEGRTLRRRRS